MVVRAAERAMQWPPVHGGTVYWYLRNNIFRIRRYNRRVIRIVRENYDNQLERTMELKRSYDPRLNQWLVSDDLHSHTGFVSNVGDHIYENGLKRLMFMMFLVYGIHTIWLQEKTGFQMYLKWRKAHAADRLRRLQEAEEEAAEES